ncbi:isoflavone reductase [Tanacetum coccineum]|uniref:Isoflavone reductase n=1 Tax=Tanacetum coccineum TaxID=301880 RepID=A0ABQ5HTQ6_9ASTR
MMPLGDHAAQWDNYLGELVREFPLHHPSWRQVPPEQKAGVVAKIGTSLTAYHMEFVLDHWPKSWGIQQHLQKLYNGKKDALKERYWVPNEDGTYDVERIRRGHPVHIFATNWDEQIAFWNDPKNLARAAQNKKNRAKSTVICRQGSRLPYHHTAAVGDDFGGKNNREVIRKSWMPSVKATAVKARSDRKTQQFLPSEFGIDPSRMESDVDYGKETFEDKVIIRNAIEDAKIPYTYISANGLAGYFVGNLAQFGSLVPPKDRVSIHGDGNCKAVFMDEDDVATYTIKTIDDPRMLNKTLYLRPDGNIVTQNQLVEKWEKVSNKTLEKVYVSKEDFLASMKLDSDSLGLCSMEENVGFSSGKDGRGFSLSEDDAGLSRDERFSSHEIGGGFPTFEVSILSPSNVGFSSRLGKTFREKN